jgi:hypothetical protein
MATPNLIKLAPTLSVEERYKIIIPECYRMFRGEKGLLTESEVTAIASFEKNEVWAQYALRFGMFKWAHILWIRDIQKEKFCACTCILLLNNAVWRMIGDEDESKGKAVLTDNLATVRKCVSTLRGKLADFYLYREALIRLQEELYDVPIFDGERAETIQGFFRIIGETVEYYNETIRLLCTNKKIKRHFTLIAQDIDSYLVKETKPDEAAIAELVDEVRSYAQSDVNARLGK